MLDKEREIRLRKHGATVYGPNGQVLLYTPKQRKRYVMNAAIMPAEEPAAAYVANVTVDMVHQRLAHPAKKVTEEVAREMWVDARDG